MKDEIAKVFNGKVLLPLLIGVVVFVGAVMYSNSKSGAMNDTISELQGQLTTLENEYALKLSTQTQENERVIKLVTGVEQERKANDDSKMTSIMYDVVTWSSYAEYCQKRQNFIDTYGEDEPFLNMFFPAVAVATSADGTQYNTIDTLGLRLEFSSLNSYIVNINGNKYSYFAIVSVTADGGTNTKKSFVITYDMDANGTVTNLKGIMQ